MGARIEAFATVKGRRGLFSPRSRRLADRAAAACLERARRSPRDVELLINSGVYRDGNLGEPALAALIQKDIGANLRQDRFSERGTFSFDVGNGGAGVITAMYLLDGFLQDSIDLGLVVTSDAHPGSEVSPRFPFSPLGGALLLGVGSEAEGFAGFQLDTYPALDLFTSEVAWREGPRNGGRNVLVIDERPGYAERCVECAVRSTRRFLDRLRLEAGQLDLIVPSQLPGNFPDAFGESLAVPGERIARAGNGYAAAHTAGPIAALESAERDGRLRHAETILFVGVGAGVTVGLALYRKPPTATWC